MKAASGTQAAAVSYPTPPTRSRLPGVETTIFTVMSGLAQQHGAVNLGQGFPDFDGDPALRAAVGAAMASGANQYAPMAGVPALRAAVSAKIDALYGHHYDADAEITITAGATQAIGTAIAALVHPGDEVIVLDPCFDCYVPAITLAGGVAVRVPLTTPGYRPDFDAIHAALGPRTRAIVVNTPHNPSGTVWSDDEMRQLADVLRPTAVCVVSDEVYEHMVYDGRRHESVARHPELAARSLLVSSFGKTLHVTGWKVGYVAAPAVLTREFRGVHQFNVFSVNTPMQVGIAAYMEATLPHLALPAFYQRKRDLFRTGLAATGFRMLPCEGSYFQCVDYAALSSLPDVAFCRWLTEYVGVAAIPLSPFEGIANRDRQIIRFCFAKQDVTLQMALERLSDIG